MFLIMSLKFVESRGLRNTGSGFKVVRQIDEGVFIPYFYYFLRSGYGGLPPSVEVSPALRPFVVKTRTVYRFFETTKVKADCFARALNGVIYPAGIHAWFDLDHAEEQFKTLSVLDNYTGPPDARLVLVKFRWQKPVAFDNTTLVSMAGSPIEVIETAHLKEELK